MKILLISNECSKSGRIGNPIIYRIQDSLRTNSLVEDVFFSPFRNSIMSFYEIRRSTKNADLIHIQFGGIYALLVWISLIGIRKPKLLTFHGTDIHAKEILTTKSIKVKLKIWLNQKASFLSFFLFDRLGVVSETLIDYIPQWIYKKCQNKIFFQPLGVDYDMFTPMEKKEACKVLGIEEKKYALFSDKSGTKLKRKDIAVEIVKELGEEFELLVMCGVKPSEVPFYINACEFVLLTSDQEGSPNIIREALALNKPVFSVDVGDVRQQILGLKCSSIISRNPQAAASTITQCLNKTVSENTRDKLRKKIEFKELADDIIRIYVELLSIK